MICNHVLHCINSNGHCITFTIMISQTTSGSRSLTHGKTPSTPSEWLDNTKYSLRTWIRKNTAIILETSHKKKKIARVDAEERYLSYVLLQQSGRQHVKLKSDIQNDYTAGDDRYPKTRQDTLHILTQYTKPTIHRNTKSQGKSSAQWTGDGSNLQTYEKAYWKYKYCYNFHQEGHPSSHLQRRKKRGQQWRKVQVHQIK